jgi:hypothetical protein
MQLKLVMPNLLDVAPEALASASAPALARLLATVAEPVAEPDGPLAIACASLGIAKQHDWPLAPWLARADGIDAGDRYWLCAEPVSLEVGRDEGRLAAPVGDLDDAESSALLSSLQAHFAADGIDFVRGASGRWLLAVAETQHLETSPPDAARGDALIAHLPRGRDAGRWRRWQSEMQMLLFEHPVNLLRERRGRPPVNYVWLWGGGTLRAMDRAAAPANLFAGSPLLRDLARAAGAHSAVVPDSLAALRASPAALVWFDSLEAPALPERLAALNADWASPLERALDAGEIAATLVIGGSRDALSFTPRAAGAMRRVLRRWSRAPDLSALLAAHVDG